MATIYDVARECGFALSTVSNVINNGPRPVRPETRRRILDAMQRLDYHPNAVARGLARQRTNNLGILFGVVDPSAIVINAYSTAILQGALTAAAQAGYNITHLTRPWIDKEHSLSYFNDRSTDGILAVALPTGSDLIPCLSSLNVPLVAVSWPPEVGGVPSVDIDDVHGTRLVMRHLLELGHTRIAHITGHPNLVSACVRQDIYLQCLAEAGIAPLPEYLRVGFYTPEAGYEHASHLMALPQPPTAIFAGNDEIAIGVLTAARDRGVRVPEQLSVVGVDNRPELRMVTPPLTTLRQPFVPMGEEAIRLLIQRVEGQAVPATTRLFKPDLIERGSTAPPAQAGDWL